MSLFIQEKRVLLTILAAVLVGLLGAGYLLLPDTKKEPAEFRGMKWGSNVRDLPEMKLLAEEGDLKFFEKRLKLLAQVIKHDDPALSKESVERRRDLLMKTVHYLSSPCVPTW